MVMNTFRSKLRRRRDEFFRRGSDDSDEWQFVPFNPSVYPGNNNNNTLNNNGISSRRGGGGAPSTPKPALRPWAQQRASWQETNPPVPPHGHGSLVKGYFPLPPCPETSPPPLPPHSHGYPGSVPNWYGVQFPDPISHYPASVPPGHSRPTPVVLRRAARAAPSPPPPPPPEAPPPKSKSTKSSKKPSSAGVPSTRVPSTRVPSTRVPSTNGTPATNEIVVSRSNSSGSSRPNSSGGSRPNSSGGSRPNSSGGSRPNSGCSRPSSSSGASRPSSVGSRPNSGIGGGGGAGDGGSGSRPSSGGFELVDGKLVVVPLEGIPPMVPPHGRPAVPPHVVNPRTIMPPSTLPVKSCMPPPPPQPPTNSLPMPPPPTVPIPPPPVPAHAKDEPPIPCHAHNGIVSFPDVTTEGPPDGPLPAPPPPAHACDVVVSKSRPRSGQIGNLTLEQLAPYMVSMLNVPSDQELSDGLSPDSPEYKVPVDASPEYKSPIGEYKTPIGSKECTIGSEECTIDSVECTIGSKECTIGSEDCTIDSVECTIGSEECTIGSEECTIGSVECTIGSEECTIDSVECTIGSVESTIVTEECSPCSSPGEKGSSIGGGSNKEQRRSDPGSVAGVAVANHTNSNTNPPTTNSTHHHNTSNTISTTSLPSNLPNNGSDALEDFNYQDSSFNASSTDSAPLAALSNKHSLHNKKKNGTAINRSESCKEKQHGRAKRTRENRKHSDPNIPTSKTDVEAESSGLIPGSSGSSSNSSLSQSLESPSTSLEQVSAPVSAPLLENDSDIEAEVDLPNWHKLVPSDQLKRLKSKESKRQDTINELFHTERTHVRVLKVLKHLFQVPMEVNNVLQKDQLDMLFPNMDQILETHVSFNQAMKKRREEEPLVSKVGDLLINMFDGPQGEVFQQQAAEFVRTQGIALESLKQRQKRDQRLATFLQDTENNPHCRRLQLKDMLPAGFQRLSKYPLLMESLLGYTDSNKEPDEYKQISRALERSKEILAFVNLAVQEAENNQRLSEIQKRLDQSSLAKNKHGHSDELRGNLDLTKHKLIYEGPLTWRIAKGQKNIDLLVLLLEEFIVLLQKSDDKYILKNHSISKSLGKDDNKLTHSPIIKYGPSMLYRAVATDRCAFFIVTTQIVGAQIYELVTISANERKVWFRHIQEAQEAYSARDGRNRRSHPQTSLADQDDQPASSADVDDGVDIDGGDAADGSNDVSAESKALHVTSKNQDQTTKSEESSSTSTSTPTTGQPPSSPDTLSKKTEHLRRKDLKIRQALEEKQHIIADILNIPHEHFENVVDMAGEPAVGNKEPRELVLAAMFQAQCLQETLNEALNIGEGDIVAARATNNDAANKASSNLPLYQAPMTKLMSISTSLSQQLASLLNLISERDDERERMRKELVASRERLHLLHMRQNSNQPTSTTTSTSVGVTQPVATSPHTSRPSSFVSVTSSTADHSDTPDHHDTDEESRNEIPKVNSLHPMECEDSKEDVVPETFEDAVSGGEQTEATSRENEGSTTGQEECNEGIGSRESEGNTEVTTTT